MKHRKTVQHYQHLLMLADHALEKRVRRANAEGKRVDDTTLSYALALEKFKRDRAGLTMHLWEKVNG